jgi:hypothetical protein
MPTLDLNYPDHFIDHISPPYEEPTTNLPSTARQIIFEEVSIYLASYHASCDGTCDPALLIAGNRSSSLDRLTITESLNPVAHDLISVHHQDVINQIQRSMWHLVISSPHLDEQSDVKPTIIPISLSIGAEYHAGATE